MLIIIATPNIKWHAMSSTREIELLFAKVHGTFDYLIKEISLKLIS
jgi:hypothetical protein